MSSAIVDILSVYPELTESRLKAKAIVNYLISELDTTQIDRLERLVEDRILGKISKDDFYISLDHSIEQEGAGFNYQSSKKIGDSIEALLAETDIIQKNIEMSDEKTTALDDAIKEILTQLSDALTSPLSEEQAKRLSDCIKRHLTGATDKTGFFKELDMSFSHGGVGLRKEIAEDMTRRMEILLIKFKNFTE